MTTPTEAIYLALSTHIGLRALVANGTSPETYRINSLIAPQDSDKPYLVFDKVSQLRENTMASSGGSGVENQRCRIHIFGDTLASCEAVSEQVRLAFIAYASSNFKAVQVFNLDNYESDTHLYHVIVDYSVWYRH